LASSNLKNSHFFSNNFHVSTCFHSRERNVKIMTVYYFYLNPSLSLPCLDMWLYWFVFITLQFFAYLYLSTYAHAAYTALKTLKPNETVHTTYPHPTNITDRPRDNYTEIFWTFLTLWQSKVTCVVQPHKWEMSQYHMLLSHWCKYSKNCLNRTPYVPETWTNGK
jgi:hypothetical protein